MRLFILEDCPYCIRARKWIKELCDENPCYQNISIEIIDEAKEVELADSYDYYYVPCFFDGQRKLHEGAITKQEIQTMFDDYLGGHKL